MSGSSDSSGGRTASSIQVEDLKRIVREMGKLDQLIEQRITKIRHIS
jgi:hypothetical protein